MHIFKWAPLLYELLCVRDVMSHPSANYVVCFCVPPLCISVSPPVRFCVPPCVFLCPPLCVSVSPPVRFCVPPMCVSVSPPLCLYYLKPNYGVRWGLGAHLPQPCCDFYCTEEGGQVLSLFFLGLDQAAQFLFGFKVHILIVVCSL